MTFVNRFTEKTHKNAKRKELTPEKRDDDDYYVLTLAGIAMELYDMRLTEADVIVVAGLHLTQTSGQKAGFAAYLAKNKEVWIYFPKTSSTS